MLLIVEAIVKNGSTPPAQPHTVPMSAVNKVSLWKPFLSARLGGKEKSENKHRAAHRFHTEVSVLITCTVGANSSLKVFLCPQGIP